MKLLLLSLLLLLLLLLLIINQYISCLHNKLWWFFLQWKRMWIKYMYMYKVIIKNVNIIDYFLSIKYKYWIQSSQALANNNIEINIAGCQIDIGYP